MNPQDANNASSKNNPSKAESTSSDWAGARPMTKKAAQNCKDFLKILGQTIKLMTLYKPEHPVPTSALQEGHAHLKRIFTDMDWEEVNFSTKDGRWYVNDTLLSESAHIPGILTELFRLQELQSVTFMKGIMLYELAALCELGAIPSQEVMEVAAADFLKQKGVRHMNARVHDCDMRQNKPPARPAVPPEIESPIPQRTAAAYTPPPSAPAPIEGPASQTSDPNRGFGSFIKNLVEQSVSDPQERARIYRETLRMVKNTIEQRVEKTTQHLRLQRHVVTNERERTETVVSGFAGGRITVDAQGRILMMDPIAEKIFGKRLVEVAGRPVLDCVDDPDKFASLSDDLTIPHDRNISKNIRLAGRESAVRTFQNSMAVVQDEQGRVVGTYSVMPHQTKFKEAEQKEEEFLAHITHELKAPLSSICSALEILEDMTGKDLKPQEKKFLDISRRNGARLKTMIDEILDFSKIKAGKLHTELTPTELAPIIAESVEGLQPWSTSKQLELTVDLSDLTGDARMVLADHGRVVQILTNLISNAIKNTPKGGKVLVTARPGTDKHEGTAVVTVQDTGCGISRENQAKIFERFQQVALKDKHRDGVGLGLSIVKHLITAHHGSLWVESEENKGASFHFTLPVAAEQPPVPL